MTYYFSKTIQNTSFEEAVNSVKEALKERGFGVITEIDFQKTLKEKLGVEFPKYLVLEACNPPFAYRSLNAEDKIGTLLPCNLIVQEKEGQIEVSSVNPESMMADIENPEIQSIAKEVSELLEQTVESL